MGKLQEEHEAFLKALEASTCSEFLVYVRRHKAKSDVFSLSELLQSLSRKLRPRLCAGILNQVNLALQLYETSTPDEGEVVDERPKELDEAVEALLGAALLVGLLLEEGGVMPPPLQAAIVQLHDRALLAAAETPALQDAVARLCSSWWLAGAPGRECVVPQLLPYLLLRALATGRAADVKRCHAVRAALELLDFDDASIADLKRLLLRAAFAPAFLRPPEGRRYLSHLFTLQPQLVRELTAIIRNQIPTARKWVLDAYGEVLYRAWRDTAGDCRYEVEHTLIQGLMQAAIVAGTPALAASLRRVLDGLHAHKVAGAVEALLLRLYEPILFRALAATNPAVRRNALELLLAAFPLTDPEGSEEDRNALLTRQFAIIGDCLGDAAPAVRVAAVRGICGLLAHFWELVPAATAAGFLTRLAGSLACDAAWPGVRAAVAEGMGVLVGTPAAHPVLRALLPRLAPLMRDSALRVRLAMADLMLLLGRVRELHFYEVVPLDTLLAVMGSNTPAVSHRIQRLLLPSYFPGPEDGPARVAALLRTNPAAGKAFCQFLAGRMQGDKETAVAETSGLSVPVEHVAALVAALRDHLLASAPTLAQAGTAAAAARPRGRKRSSKARKEAAGSGEAEQEPAQGVETPESWEAMLAGLAELCAGLAGELARGAMGQAALDRLLPRESLLQMLVAAAKPAGRAAVVAIAAALPELPASAQIRGRCFSAVLRAPSGSQPPQLPTHEATAMLRCICSGSSATRLALALDASLAGGVAVDGAAPPAELGASRRAEASEDEDPACEACGSRGDEASMLLCDGCDAPCHAGCLDPPLAAVPEGDWFCAACREEIRATAPPPLVALWCLDLIMRDEACRDRLLHDGSLRRLLPRLEEHVGVAVEDLISGLGQGSSPLQQEDSAASDAGPSSTGSDCSQAIMVYCRAAIHVQMAATLQHAPKASEENGDGEPAESSDKGAVESAAGQALDRCMEWAEELKQRIAEHPGAAMPQSEEPAPPKPKRGRKARSGTPTPPPPSSQQPGQLLEEAQQAVLAVAALLGDAARLRLVRDEGGSAAAAARLAASCARGMGTEAEGCRLPAGEAAAHLARLACQLVAQPSSRPHRAGEGLDPLLRQVDGTSGPTEGSDPGLLQLVLELLSSCREDAGGEAAVSAMRPFLPQLLATLQPEGSTLRSSSRWLEPVAEAAGQHVLAHQPAATQHSPHLDAPSLAQPAIQQPAGEVAAEEGSTANCSAAETTTSESRDDGKAGEPESSSRGEGDENIAGAANLQAEEARGASARKQRRASRGRASGAKSDRQGEDAAAAGLPEPPPVVRAVVWAAGVAKVGEQLAETSAELAAYDLPKGRYAAALGAVHFMTLLGFQGHTTRGKCRGSDGFAAAAAKLKNLSSILPVSSDASLVQLQGLLADLFPPLPRVVFEAL